MPKFAIAWMGFCGGLLVAQLPLMYLAFLAQTR